jgi:hypothetical protein
MRTLTQPATAGTSSIVNFNVSVTVRYLFSHLLNRFENGRGVPVNFCFSDNFPYVEAKLLVTGKSPLKDVFPRNARAPAHQALSVAPGLRDHA